MIMQFFEKCSTWTAWDVPRCGGQFVLQYDRAAAGPEVLQCNISQQSSRCGQLTARPHLMPVDAFRVRTPKEAYLCSPSKDYWHLRQLWQWLMPPYCGVMERMPRGTMSSVLKQTEAMHAYCNHDGITIWSLHILHHLTVTCILRTTCVGTLVASDLPLTF